MASSDIWLVVLEWLFPVARTGQRPGIVDKQQEEHKLLKNITRAVRLNLS
jgi:hypothetical protein